jgi:hypothetical protein
MSAVPHSPQNFRDDSFFAPQLPQLTKGSLLRSSLRHGVVSALGRNDLRLHDERSLFMTRDSESPYLVQFPAYPCDEIEAVPGVRGRWGAALLLLITLRAVRRLSVGRHLNPACTDLCVASPNTSS